MSIVLAALVLAASPFESAEEIPRLDAFLDAYVGTCRSHAPAVRAECERDAHAARRRLTGEAFRLEGDARVQLSVRSVDAQRGVIRVRILPFWSEGGLGLSVGRPRRLDGQGNPLVRTLDLEVPLPDDEPAFIARRRFEMGRVRLEWVVRPQSSWSLSRPGEDEVRGVAVRPVALRIVEPRTGKVVTEKTW